MLEPQHKTEFMLYPYQKIADQTQPPKRHPVVLVGGGPVGLALALDLGLKGTPVLLLDDHEGVGGGSRAICFAKRTLEITDRLGCGQAMRDKGVVWNVGKVFYGDETIFEFNLAPEEGYRNPAFINLQQPYFERFLVEEIHHAQENGAPIEIRGSNRVVDIQDNGDFVSLDVQTPDGPYRVEADWLVACDGARSTLRSLLGLGFDGRIFEDNFLIADVRMSADFPTERWFWFEPPFEGAGQSALLHKQPDNIWRIDFQLGWDIDRAAELDPTRIHSRIDAMLKAQTGSIPQYELEWSSIYTFQCRRMDKFRHGSVLFAGDSAHQVSPFGARGANSGIQDADNLGWKLDLVVNGKAPDSLLDSYTFERIHGADENILNSTRTTDFLTPKSDISKVFRNAVLSLAKNHDFARPFVNSGRLSVPCVYDHSELNSADEFDGPMQTRPGAPCPDALLKNGYLLDQLGDHFTLLTIDQDAPDEITADDLVARRIALSATDDPSEAFRNRYLGDQQSAVYLIRPDQHVAARWPEFDGTKFRDALLRASGRRKQ